MGKKNDWRTKRSEGGKGGSRETGWGAPSHKVERPPSANVAGGRGGTILHTRGKKGTEDKEHRNEVKKKPCPEDPKKQAVHLRGKNQSALSGEGKLRGEGPPTKKTCSGFINGTTGPFSRGGTLPRTPLEKKSGRETIDKSIHSKSYNSRKTAQN